MEYSRLLHITYCPCSCLRVRADGWHSPEQRSIGIDEKKKRDTKIVTDRRNDACADQCSLLMWFVLRYVKCMIRLNSEVHKSFNVSFVQILLFRAHINRAFELSSSAYSTAYVVNSHILMSRKRRNGCILYYNKQLSFEYAERFILRLLLFRSLFFFVFVFIVRNHWLRVRRKNVFAYYIHSYTYYGTCLTTSSNIYIFIIFLCIFAFLFAKRPTCQLACNTLLPVLTWKQTRALAPFTQGEIPNFTLLNDVRFIFSAICLTYDLVVLNVHPLDKWPVNSSLAHSAMESVIPTSHSAISHLESIIVDFVPPRPGIGIIQSIKSCRFGIPERKKNNHSVSR